MKKAADTVVELLDKPGRNAMVRLAAARDILDRGGLKPPASGLNFNVPLEGGSSVTLNIIAVPAAPKPELLELTNGHRDP